MASRFQQLGAFVSVSENLTEHHVSSFAECGGRYIHVVLEQLSRTNGDSVVNNQRLYDEKRKLCDKYKVAYGSWFNGWGGDTTTDANLVISTVKLHNCRPVTLDLEAPYQNGVWTDPLTGEQRHGEPEKMAELLLKVKNGLPGTAIFVSTNGMNSSMIYNGRSLVPARSFYDLGIRCQPQWYSFVYEKDGSYKPQAQMKWLRDNGKRDFNFADPTSSSGYGLPPSYVHGTLEVTGLEGSDLATEIADLKAAKCSPGWSIYLLENTPDSDWPLLAAERGHTFLV